MIHTSGHILIFWEKVVKLVELWLQVVAVKKLWRKKVAMIPICIFFSSGKKVCVVILNRPRYVGC